MRNLALMWALAGVAESGILRNSMLYWNKIMKKYMIFLLIFFICPVCAQDSDPYDCYGFKSIERKYQLLLKRWRDGADGHGQGGPVDSVVLDLLKWSKFYDKDYADVIKKSPRMLQLRDDLHRYRGLGIFLKEDYHDPTAIKVLKKYYNINIRNLKNYELWSTGVEYFYGMPQFMLVWLQKKHSEEWIFYLISNTTDEVVSTYKEKIKKPSPLKKEPDPCEGKDGIFMEFIGPDSIKITEF